MAQWSNCEVVYDDGPLLRQLRWRETKKSESTALVKVETAAEPAVIEGEVVATEAPRDTVHLVARNPAEMQAARGDLLVWLKQKLTTTEAEIRDLNASVEEARQNGWKTDALTRARNRMINLETFYFKMLMAVEAGYTIIPDFPIDVFAIRVNRSGVRELERTQQSTWGWPTIPNQPADTTPAGSGEYRNPEALERHYEWKDKDSKGEEVVYRQTVASKFQDEIVFPMIAARPEVMNATAGAMALKVFDQIGICRPVKEGRQVRFGKGDPLIIGQILLRRPQDTKVVNFIIAWHLNLNDL